MAIYMWRKTYNTMTITRTEKSDMSSWWVYSDDAEWLTAWSTVFDEFFWYYGCRLSTAGVESAKIEQTTPWTLDITQLWTLTSWDNVMIAFPVRWIKMSKSGDNVTLSITKELGKEWYQYYAHTKGSTIKDNLYIWAYKMVSWYKSLSWAAPLVNQTRASFRSWIKSTYDSSAWTNRYSQITRYPREYINALYMMKYWNPYATNVIWAWLTTGSVAVNTWWTDSQTSATYGTSSASQQMKLFWLEDYYGNVAEWLDWCYYNSSKQLTVDKTNNVFQDSAYSTNLWATNNWWMSKIIWTNDSMFNNNMSLGAYNTWYTSARYNWSNQVLFVGGLTWANRWILYEDCMGADESYSYIWARLQYL